MQRADRKDSRALFSAEGAGTMMAEKGTRGEAIPRIISFLPFSLREFVLLLIIILPEQLAEPHSAASSI